MILHAKLPNDWNKYCDLKRTLQCLCRQSQNKSFLHYWTPTIKLQNIFGHLAIKHKCEDKVGINTLHSSGQTYTKNKEKAVHKTIIFICLCMGEYPHTEGEQVSDIPPSTIEVYGVKKLLENLDPHIIYSST